MTVFISDPEDTNVFTIALNELDYSTIIHALVYTANCLEVEKGDEAAEVYDVLHDKLQDWNCMDLHPEWKIEPSHVAPTFHDYKQYSPTE